MRLFLHYIKYYYEKYRLFILILLIISFLTISFLMIKEIVFNFPNKASENYYLALSQLFGGILGGLLTLTGVVITIYFTNNSRRKDIIALDKPLLLFDRKTESKDSVKVLLDKTYETDKKYIFNKSELNKEQYYCSFKPFSVYLTSNADCILEDIIINGEMIYPLRHRVIFKRDNTYIIDISDYYFICSEKTIPEITLSILSINEKKYYFTMLVDEFKVKEDKIYKVKFDDILERVYGYDKIMDKLLNELEIKSNIYLCNKYKEKIEHQNKDL